jgi:hypothetical protein
MLRIWSTNPGLYSTTWNLKIRKYFLDGFYTTFTISSALRITWLPAYMRIKMNDMPMIVKINGNQCCIPALLQFIGFDLIKRAQLGIADNFMH